MIARKIALAIGALVVLSSGSYLFIYLYRWEWNRATIAGILLISAEIGLVAMLLHGRLRAIERRLDEREAEPDALTPLRSTQPPPRRHFKWLADEDRDLGVFIPVLMGAGVVFSGLAWMIEQLARATARPALERNLAARLDVLGLPEGGFLSPNLVRRDRPRFDRQRAKIAFYVFVAASAAYTGIGALGDLTQNRPELDVIVDESETLTLDITRQGWSRSDVNATQALWVSCQQTVAPFYQADDFVAAGRNKVSFTVTPGLAMGAQRRLVGCLQDATLDNVSATVVRIGTGS